MLEKKKIDEKRKKTSKFQQNADLKLAQMNVGNQGKKFEHKQIILIEAINSLLVL